MDKKNRDGKNTVPMHGPIKALKATGPWFNILDPRFNLHLPEDAIPSAWVVKKPTSDGTVTSLELFDAGGFCFVQFLETVSQAKRNWRAGV